MPYTTLTAMFTPALFLLGTGTFIVSTSNRMSRVVDRIRILNEFGDTIRRGASSHDMRPDRMRHIEESLERMDTRSRMIRRALTLLYLANGMFVGTSLTLALDVQLGNRVEWLPTLFAVLGACCLLAASVTLLSETRIAFQLNKDEVTFYRDLQKKRLELEGRAEA